MRLTRQLVLNCNFILLTSFLTSNLFAGEYSKQALKAAQSGNYGQSILLYKKDLAIEIKKHGVNHASVATIYNSMGTVYKNMRLFNKSIKTLDLAIKSAQNAEQKDPATIAMGYYYKGLTYISSAKPSSAILMFVHALKIRKRAFGEKHPSVIQGYIYLAVAYGLQGQFKKSFYYNRKAYILAREILDKRHEYVKSSFHNMTWARIEWIKQQHRRRSSIDFRSSTDLNNVQENNRLNRKIAKQKVKDTKMSQPRMVASYQVLGLAFHNKGQYENALQQYRKALDIQLVTLGAGHPDIAVSLFNMSNAYKGKKDTKKAIVYVKKAIVIAKKQFGSAHAVTKLYINSLKSLTVK